MKQIPKPTQNWFKFPNYIYDILPELTGNEVKIILAMCRKENYTSPNFKWSISYLAKITGMGKTTVIECKKSLLEKELILEDGNAEDGSKFLFINWEKSLSENQTPPIQKLDTPYPEIKQPPIQKLDTPYPEIKQPPIQKLDTVLENSKKEHNQKDIMGSNDIYKSIIDTIKKEFGNTTNCNYIVQEKIMSIIKNIDNPIEILKLKCKSLISYSKTDGKKYNIKPNPYNLEKYWDTLVIIEEVKKINIEDTKNKWKLQLLETEKREKELIEKAYETNRK